MRERQRKGEIERNRDRKRETKKTFSVCISNKVG